MKNRFVCTGLVAGLLALSAPVWAFDLNDSFNSLKDAVEKKDAAQVKTLAPQVSKQARDVLAKGDAAADVTEFAKGADAYSEYALSTVGAQSSDAAVTVELVDMLIAQNPKSKYLDDCAQSYLSALSKQGAAKATAGAQKILTGRPDNEWALYYAASGTTANPAASGGYANKLIAAVSKKPKPEGESDADWEREKSSMLGSGYYFAGLAAGARQSWAECDRDLKAAEPLIKGQAQMLGVAYYFMGVANYQIGKLTQDRTKIQAGLKYSQMSAGMAGPMQGQASNNVAVISKELGVGAGRR